MTIKFAIKNTADKARKEGEHIIRYSGTFDEFSRGSERGASAVEVDSQGTPTKWIFQTGLDEEQVEFYNWLTDEEKEVVKQQIKELRPRIAKYFGGDTMLKPDNWAFWKKRVEVNKFKISNENIDIIYNTDRPEMALLYLSIVGGAFGDLIAPNKEWAERHQLPHYLALEQDLNSFEGEEDITRSEAHGELSALRKEFGKEALYILAWCLQYDTNAFGAYNYGVSEKDLINYHIKYIDGKLQTKGFKKPNYPKLFMEYAEKWRGAQTKPLLYTEAYVKAGEYFNFISQREKKFVTSDGTVLGNTVTEAVNNLMKPKFKVDLETLRNNVESKWKE